MNQRPDLYAAMVIGVPLLDMQRYTKLGAGASWVAEYGDPETKDWSYMSKWSPYQNMRDGVAYPPVFYYTSTKDDRVHPGHARKAAARTRLSSALEAPRSVVSPSAEAAASSARLVRLFEPGTRTRASSAPRVVIRMDSGGAAMRAG